MPTTNQKSEVLSVTACSMFGPLFMADGEFLSSIKLSELEEMRAENPHFQVELMAVGYDEKLGEAGGLKGVVIAEARTFATQWRGRFTRDSLQEILKLWPQEGLRSAIEHPMIDTGVLRYVGRMRKPRMSRALYEPRQGKAMQVPAIRADLHYDLAAATGPLGDLTGYLTQRVANDPKSLATSLTLFVERIYETDKKGKPKTDKEGNELPPIWMPQELLGVDIVAAGDAVTSILSTPESPPSEGEAEAYDPRRDRRIELWRRRAARYRVGVG